MKTGLAKCLPLLLISVIFMAGSGIAFADTTNKPYIKDFGADVMAGGWFKNGNSCASDPSTTNYQNSNFSSASFAGDARSGGILTYTKSSGVASGGASSQYGAYALGEIDGRRAGDGFYSSGAQPGSNVKKLSFANTDGSLPFGGVFEGSITQSNCIPDYFSKVDPSKAQAPPAGWNWRPVFSSSSSSGTYYSTAPGGSSLNLFGGSGAGDLVLKAGLRIAIFINGNVFIDHNVVYDPASTVDQVTKFILVVKGSIYVDPSVTRLDGVYIAQPKDDTPSSLSSDTGVFWSCHPQSTASIDIYYPPNCTNTLVVNGAVIAKQANLIRVKGDVASSNTGEDSLSTITNCQSGACNVSEVFNYAPSVIMGGSFFDTTSTGTPGPLRIDNVISLPPVF